MSHLMQDAHAQQLAYHQRRQCKPGWQDLVQTLFSGILSTAEGEDGHQFLRLMGGDLARRHPLPACRTVGELEDNLNRLLAGFDWGEVTLMPGERSLTLTHIAWPQAPDADQGNWQAAFAAVLEGAYAVWLQTQGGHDRVPLRWQGANPQHTLHFRYQAGL
ncbi:cellulose biosynthesis protein BcsD [Chimaeribacter arupi]|uniref:cellulose biosynthesis protein BcsD n=1 Tax=Chimaeribacter arupi TaxID=2060066 RepID=UPI0027120B22|nr:cellulose biosynthesis protein BcsD [Chimaeribacter arupi]WKZ92484.1 cellulose biosynthesis protein BcsD [Chimaeribacter arupi]